MKKDIEMVKFGLLQEQLISAKTILEDLSEHEYRVFKTLVKLRKQSQHSPTLKELAEELGVTKQNISYFIIKLEKKGYLKRVGYGRIDLTHKDADVTVKNVDMLRPVLEELKKLYEDKLITEEEYEQKRKSLLGI